MSDGKDVLQWLRQWTQTAASRILELPYLRKNISFYSQSIGDYLNRVWVDWRDFEDERIKALIAEGKFEEACNLAYGAYGAKIKDRCVTLNRYVLNPRVDAEDVVQQVFFEFLRMLKAGKYEPSKGSIHGLLRIIAERRTKGKRRTRNKIVLGRDLDVSELDRRNLQESHASNPELIALLVEENILQNYYQERLNHALERLSAKEKQILHWRYKLGYSTGTIARFTGEKRGTIASIISRACAKLRAVCNSETDYRSEGGRFLSIFR